MKSILATMAIALVSMSHSAFALDSQKGTTSTDSFTVGVTVPLLVKASGFSNINLGSFDYVNAKSGYSNGCVYSNNSGSYTVTASAQYNNSGTQFLMKHSSTSDAVPLSVSWCTSTNGSNCAALSYGTESSAKSGAHTTSITCSGSNNVSLKIDATVANMKKPPGTYSGDIYILISPD